MIFPRLAEQKKPSILIYKHKKEEHTFEKSIPSRHRIEPKEAFNNLILSLSVDFSLLLLLYFNSFLYYLTVFNRPMMIL